MNILLINHYAGSPHHGMEFRPYYLAREWIRMGHKVKIVAGGYSHIRSKQPEISKGNRVEDELIDGIDFRWYATPKYVGNGVGRVRSMLSFIWHLWRDGKKISADFMPDFVVASSTYPMDIWPAQRIAKMAGAKLVYEVHDLWPLSPMELGGLSKWHPFIMWVQMAEDYAYRHVDKVVSMLPKALHYMHSRGLDISKFSYVPNGVDVDEWRNPQLLPSDIDNSLAELKEAGLPIVAYVGTHGVANALDLLLDASKLLQGEVRILLVGPGPERERLAARVEEEALTNVTMLPSVPKHAVPTLLEKIDIAYIGWHNNPLYRFGISPNKLMDYMMAGKAIVHSVKAGNDPVSETGCGVTVLPGSSELVAEAIRRLAKLSPDERSAMGKKGRDFILKNQTYPVLAKRFISAIES